MNFIFSCLMILSFAGQEETPSRQTQDLLRSKEAREKAIKELPENAQIADQNVNKIVSGDAADKEELYNISASVFNNFEGKSAEEMQIILQKAQQNPEAFYNSLSAEQKEKIKKLSDKIEKKKSAKP